MSEPNLRPLSQEERLVLRRLASGSAEWTGDLLNGGVVFALVFVAAVVVGRLFSVPPAQVERGGAFVAIVLGILTVTYMRRQHPDTHGRAAYLRDLAGGMAEEVTYDIVDAIRVEEFEDEGSQYFLELADGRVLFLMGQYLYEPEETRMFPCRRIRITRAPNSRFLIDLACEGPYLGPSSVRPPFSTREHQQSKVPDDGDVLEVNFGDLRRLERRG